MSGQGTGRAVVLAGALALAVPAPLAAEGGVWNDLRGWFTGEVQRDDRGLMRLLERMAGLDEERRVLPESAFLTRDQGDVADEVAVLIAEAVEILNVSAATNAWAEMRAHEAERDRLVEALARLRERRVLEPSRADSLDKEIEDQLGRITASEEAAATARAEARRTLTEAGVELTDAQMDVLAVSAVGDDVLKMTVIFTAIGEVLDTLEKLMAAARTEEAGDTEAARRYYAMSVVLIRIAAATQEGFITRVQDRLLPRIAEILAAIEESSARARTLLAAERDGGRRATLERNLDTQRLTAETAELYRRHLERQRAQVADALAETRRNLAVAENTLETVRLSSELVDLIRDSRRLFDAVIRIQVPDIIPFQGDAMRAEFERMGERLLTN